LNLLSLNEKENSTLACSEDAATSKLIACFVNLALSGDLAKGKPAILPLEKLIVRS